MSKHLTLEDRIIIETQLSVGTALAEIAKILCKARSTIGREVRKHRQEQDTGAFGRAKNKCVRRRDCSLWGLCADKPDCTSKCAVCSHCSLSPKIQVALMSGWTLSLVKPEAKFCLPSSFQKLNLCWPFCGTTTRLLLLLIVSPLSTKVWEARILNGCSLSF